MKRITLLMICISLIGASSLFGQKKFQVLEQKDNVTVSYRWKAKNALKKDSPIKLVIRIDNDDASPAEISFEILYYWDALQKASSGELTYCLKANKAFTGDIKKSGFDNADFTDEQLVSDHFEMELSDLKIIKIDKCK